MINKKDLNLLLSLSSRNVKMQSNPSKMRPSDIEVIQGDYIKFKKQTGRKPEIAFEQTMADFFRLLEG